MMKSSSVITDTAFAIVQADDIVDDWYTSIPISFLMINPYFDLIYCICKALKEMHSHLQGKRTAKV